jgi:hypothetical protein
MIRGTRSTAGSKIGLIGTSNQVSHHAAKIIVFNHDMEASTCVHKINATYCAGYMSCIRVKRRQFPPKTGGSIR